MPQHLIHTDEVTTHEDIAARCAAMGLTLLAVGNDGGISARRHVPDAPIERAIVASPMFAAALRQQASRWATQDQPEPAALWPGCWAVPVALTVRRRRGGYHVAIILTAELLDSEQFFHLCDAARLDRRAMAARLATAGLMSPADLDRFARMITWMMSDLDHLDRNHGELVTLSQQLGETYEELSLVYGLSAHMAVTHDPCAFIEDACCELQQVVGYKWIGLCIADGEVRLGDLRSRLIVAGKPRCDHATLASLGQDLIRQYGSGGPRIIDQTSTLDIPAACRAADRMLIVPIVIDGRSLAVLFGGDKHDGAQLSSVDSKLATSTAQNMAIFLENAMLYEDLQGMFMGTLHAMVAAIDAKDAYTCGHSERVAWLTRELAKAAGLDHQTCERAYLSAVVHDVGKIGIPELVLCKPGRLTDDEFALIRAHPEIGVRILKDIRQMQDLLPGVLHHHERFDGKGYPHGLAGRDIPLFGRLICLADSFDAMSSNRTYRSAMPLQNVLDEIRRCAGKQFDPDLAAVFVKLDLEPYQRMVDQHQHRTSVVLQAMGGLTP
jgi:HD-GYP domain-containing protein (c-di-GMP phosphodiesterase class II)